MTDSDMVSVRPIRSYEDDGVFRVAGSAAYHVSRHHSAELVANGLVEEVGSGDRAEKMAPAPANKRAPEPANKARV